MQTTIPFNPRLWQDARKRVETHLLSYGMEPGEALANLLTQIITVAAERQQQEPWRDPVSLAAAETERILHERMQSLAPGVDTASPHAFARARAALHLSKDQNRLFARLMPEDPADVAPAQGEPEAALFQAGPEVRFSNMVPEPMHYDVVADVANETWRTFARWPVIRSSLNVMLAATGVGTAFYLANF